MRCFLRFHSSVLFTWRQERRRVVGCQRENKRIYKNDSAHTGPWVSQRIWPACYLIIGPAVTERHVDKMPHLLL